MRKSRLAIIVSHPIQYYAPLHQRLARRDDLAIKVFFTWHAGAAPVLDQGFRAEVAWDIPLTEGYDFELAPNVARNPGTHHFLGLRNPTLVQRVLDWRPDAVHLTGWAWASHLHAMRTFHHTRLPVLFRGDSHLLDSNRSGPTWWTKRAILQHIYAWPAGFLYVGTANRAYYEAFGIGSDRLFKCPHSIDVSRFAQPAETYEREAAQWRAELGLTGRRVMLFAGKFEPKKRPVELMRVFQSCGDDAGVLVMLGGGELADEVNRIAAESPTRFRVLPFQNQSRMPVVYRLGDVFVLPSAWGETWGLAVNEALACGRPIVISDRVGCGTDVVDVSCGRVFSWDNPSSLNRFIREMTEDSASLAAMSRAAGQRACLFDLTVTETSLMQAIARVCGT